MIFPDEIGNRCCYPDGKLSKIENWYIGIVLSTVIYIAGVDLFSSGFFIP